MRDSFSFSFQSMLPSPPPVITSIVEPEPVVSSLEAESIVANAFCTALSQHLDCSRTEVVDAFTYYSANLWPLLNSAAGWTTLAILMTNESGKLHPLAVSMN